MDISASQIESIVRNVLSSMGKVPAASACGGATPKVAHVAMLTGPKKIEVQELRLHSFL